MNIYSVELVVQEVEEGGPIFCVSRVPDLRPQPHNMNLLERGQLPEEVLSICEKLGISYTLGAYNNINPHDSCMSIFKRKHSLRLSPSLKIRAGLLRDACSSTAF